MNPQRMTTLKKKVARVPVKLSVAPSEEKGSCSNSLYQLKWTGLLQVQMVENRFHSSNYILYILTFEGRECWEKFRYGLQIKVRPGFKVLGGECSLMWGQ